MNFFKTVLNFFPELEIVHILILNKTPPKKQKTKTNLFFQNVKLNFDFFLYNIDVYTTYQLASLIILLVVLLYGFHCTIFILLLLHFTYYNRASLF